MKKIIIAIVAFAISISAAEAKTKTTHILSMNASPGWITSEVSTGYQEYSWRTGLGFTADYKCIFNGGYGFGLGYSMSQTSYPGGSAWNPDVKMNIKYFGPSFVYGGQMTNKWNANVEVGLGYAHYNDGYEGQSGMGYKWAANVEYMFSTAFGLGLGVEQLITVFSQNDYSEYDLNGFKRLALLAGFHIYL